MRQRLVLCSLLPLFLSGCTITSTAPPMPATGPALRGLVHGGQQPVTGAHVYLLAANTTGYNVGAATYPSVSLLNATSTGHSDSIGAYVLTDANGNFNISGDYTCTPDSNGVPGQQVYIYSSGGNSGSGTNSTIGLMAVLGDCPSTGNFATATPFVVVNEVTTIAAAYAMAGFAYDSTHVSSSGTNLAKVGIENAFANAGNLTYLEFGNARSTTPAGNGTVPQATIYTLANIIAACVNSNGAVTGPTDATNCYTLFYNAESNGSSGTVPSDTATAAINIAHNPGANITNLYDLTSTTPPFGSALTSQPNDFSIGIKFTGGGMDAPVYVAIDASGNAWVGNNTGNSVTKLSSLGAFLSGNNGYTGGGLNEPLGIAIDQSGNAWIVNSNANSVTEISSSGTILSGSSGYTGGGLNVPWGIAIDSSGNAWVANNCNGRPCGNSVTKLSSTCATSCTATNYAGGGLDAPINIAFDGKGNVWIANNWGESVVEMSSNGSILSGSEGYTGGGLDNPNDIAIDASGNAWLPNNFDASVTKVSNSGIILNGSSGYIIGGSSPAYGQGVSIDGSGNAWVTDSADSSAVELSNSGTVLTGSVGLTGGGMTASGGIAVDSSGNVWAANHTSNSITELIGAATPVITPICAGLPSTPTADGSSNLGTRP